jgi:hypothetical protein
LRGKVRKGKKEVNSAEYIRPSDYIAGEIKCQGKVVSKYDGSYCGFLNFDGVRYWDGRHMQGFKIKLEEKALNSDFHNREDLINLAEGKLEEAQVSK